MVSEILGKIGFDELNLFPNPVCQKKLRQWIKNHFGNLHKQYCNFGKNLQNLMTRGKFNTVNYNPLLFFQWNLSVQIVLNFLMFIFYIDWKSKTRIKSSLKLYTIFSFVAKPGNTTFLYFYFKKLCLKNLRFIQFFIQIL
jgi:hypothetical protein